MDSRGQVSAEYIFLILIFLIILTTVTIPFAGNAISSSQNVSITSDAQTTLSSIVNAVNVVYANGPGAKRTINVYFPQDANLVYSTNLLSLSLTGIPVNASNPSVLKPNINSSVPYPLTITNGAVTKGWHNVGIFWGVGNSSITITVT
ncbi:MAG: class III signal peptide-containing protein [Methanobacterium sp.]|nr:class III signal peptide-containing protein [Methanobacterium sp.]